MPPKTHNCEWHWGEGEATADETTLEDFNAKPSKVINDK
jgi:hypothetical protein